MLRIALFHPIGDALRTVRLRFLRQHERIRCVRTARLYFFATLNQMFKGVLTNAFQHYKARLPRAILPLLQQTLIH